MSDLEAMARLAEDARGCVSCFLGTAGRRRVVWGRGPVPADIMFVGEAPGEKEDERGIPFVGPAGEMLDRVLGSVAIDPKQLYITNIEKCRPPANRRPLDDEIEACTRRWLLPQIQLVAPRVLVALGSTPAAFFTGQSLKASRGRWTEWGNLRVFVLYHPAALLHRDGWDYPDDPKPCTWRDIQALRSALDALPPRPPDHVVRPPPLRR